MSALKIEERLTKLEAEVTQLKLSLPKNTNLVKPWWEKIVGVFADDPAFEEAYALGKQYRQSCQELSDLSEI